jgi:flagellar basal-body rod modification protein FlgD
VSNTILPTTPTSAATSAVSTIGSSDLGKDDFLKLLTAQLAHQDPLNPMDNTAFVAQLAQFSSLEQMQNVNTNLSTSILLSQSVNNSLATTLIGREVQASGNTITQTAGGNSSLGFNLDSDASVQINVVDSSGKTVATLKPGDMKAGQETVNWDGKEDDGSTAPSGDYTFNVTAADAKGNPVGAETMITGKVTGVKFENGQTYIMVGSRQLSMSDITQILDAGSGSTSSGS